MKAVVRTAKRVAQALRSAASVGCPRCASLQQQVEALREENAGLRVNLLDAQRAAKRQAAPFSKGLPKPDPKPPGRKPGRRYGVKSRRPVPDHFDESHEAAMGPGCPDCGSKNLKETKVVDQYEEDIPPVTPRIRRFRIHIGRCLDCGRRVQGRHPLQTSDALGAAGVHLGPRALTLAADLNKHIGTSFGKVRSIFRTTFSLSISRGGLSQALDRVGRTLAPTYDALVEQVQRSPVVAADETGWKVGGYLEWLWAFVTPDITVYRIMAGRGYDEACEVLGPGFNGILLRDGWGPYRQFEGATHQTCIGGHLIRRCKLNLQSAQQGTARLPHAVLRILQRALRLRDHWLDRPPSPHGRAVHAGIIAAKMDRFLAWKPTDDENRKLVKHLRNERDALFTFLRNPAVPASNWWGEQAIRPAVVTRKIWGGNRTAYGAITQERVATFFRTSHQQGADPYPLMEVALRSPVPLVAGLPSLIAGP
jgi:transposase